MISSVRLFAEAVAEMMLEKVDLGYAPAPQLEEFHGLLTAIDWEQEAVPVPPVAAVPGLRHLPSVLAKAYDAGDCPVIDALRLCIGLVPWSTFYAQSAWSQPFIDEFASGELVGPGGFIPSQDVSLGLFILGPNSTYPEHAHAASEIYYVLGGEAAWRTGSQKMAANHGAGELVFVDSHERHELRTGDQPMLAAYAWKADVAGRTYRRSEGPWAGGERVELPIAQS